VGNGGAAGSGAPGHDGSNAGSDPGTSATGGASLGGSGTGAGGGAEPCVVDHGGDVPSLAESYADHFAVGAAIDTQYQSYSNLLGTHFNSVTAEDQMKFDALQPSEGNFSYGTADQMVAFAQNNGMQVRGHALVWHRQTPSWVFNGTRDQVLARMRNHITSVMQHFAGKVGVWDVVNEAIMDDGTYRTADEVDGQQSGWYGALGEDYIREAFIAAREADPAAKLFYNDYYNYHPVRRQAIYDMLAGLLADGVPVDGVGLQCHLNLAPGTDPNEQSYHQTVENLEEAIEMYSSLGLDVQVTEMDISVYLRGITYTPDMFYTEATFTPELQEQQAERYREFFALFRKHSDKISSVSLWGIADDNTWLSEFDSGRQDFPLLFDGSQQPKAAFWAVVDFCD
jgi:endo-1,4-beta-xylanase